MQRIVLPLAFEAAFHGFQIQMEVCNAEGTAVGVFLPLISYKKLSPILRSRIQKTN
jgi:hypothetical protein